MIDFPVPATSPTKPSPISKVSELRIFSRNLALVAGLFSSASKSFRCGGNKPSTATPCSLPFSLRWETHALTAPVLRVAAREGVGLRGGVRGAAPRYLVIGNISGKHTIPFNPAWLVHQNRRMVGVGGYQAWALRRGLELLARNRARYPFEDVLSQLYPIAEINTAFAEADKGSAIRTGMICDPDLAVL